MAPDSRAITLGDFVGSLPANEGGPFAKRPLTLPNAALAWSLLVNALLVAYILAGPMLASQAQQGALLTLQPGEVLRETAAPVAAPDQTELGRCLAHQLEKAEQSYKRNTERWSQLTGSTKPQALPLEGQALAVFQAVRGTGWSDVYYREIMLFPRYPCPQEERLGMWGEGGKWLCLTPLQKPKEQLVIYSIGSRGDPSFEESVFQLLGAVSHTFDPFLTPEQVLEMEKVHFMRFHSYGLSTADQETVNEGASVGPAKGIHKMMMELNNTFVDIFKIDCEGCEVGFVEYLSQTCTREKPIFGQILMEIHNAQDLPMESLLFKRLGDLGYRLFHLEPNFFGLGTCWEVAFIHESQCAPGNGI